MQPSCSRSASSAHRVAGCGATVDRHHTGGGCGRGSLRQEDRSAVVAQASGRVDAVKTALVALAAVLLLVGCDVGLAGQPNYRAAVTIINRTTADITVSSGEGGQLEMVVPACGELTNEDFPVNWFEVTSPGRDTFHSGGGISAKHSFVLVTSVVAQQETRPDPLPGCAGLLQPAQQ